MLAGEELVYEDRDVINFFRAYGVLHLVCCKRVGEALFLEMLKCPIGENGRYDLIPRAMTDQDG